MNTSNLEKCLAAFLGGAVVGATLGILFAPDKGSNTRKKIAKTTRNFTNNITERIENLAASAGDIVEELREAAAELEQEKARESQSEKYTDDV